MSRKNKTAKYLCSDCEKVVVNDLVGRCNNYEKCQNNTTSSIIRMCKPCCKKRGNICGCCLTSITPTDEEINRDYIPGKVTVIVPSAVKKDDVVKIALNLNIIIHSGPHSLGAWEF